MRAVGWERRDKKNRKEWRKAPAWQCHCSHFLSQACLLFQPSLRGKSGGEGHKLVEKVFCRCFYHLAEAHTFRGTCSPYDTTGNKSQTVSTVLGVVQIQVLPEGKVLLCQGIPVSKAPHVFSWFCRLWRAFSARSQTQTLLTLSHHWLSCLSCSW